MNIYGSFAFAANLALYLFFLLPILVLGGEQPTGVFYADNGLKQTIAYPLYGLVLVLNQIVLF